MKYDLLWVSLLVEIPNLSSNVLLAILGDTQYRKIKQMAETLNIETLHKLSSFLDITFICLMSEKMANKNTFQ